MLVEGDIRYHIDEGKDASLSPPPGGERHGEERRSDFGVTCYPPLPFRFVLFFLFDHLPTFDKGDISRKLM